MSTVPVSWEDPASDPRADLEAFFHEFTREQVDQDVRCGTDLAASRSVDYAHPAEQAAGQDGGAVV